MKRKTGKIWGAVLLSVVATGANAQYRADFFDISRKPTVTFNAKSLTWTLRNQAIERIVRFDPKVGSLTTTVIRSLKHKQEIRPAPNSEGAISFVAPLLEPPTPLRGLQMTTTEPPKEWLTPNFDDTSWKAPLPITTAPLNPNAKATAWIRCVLPMDRLKPDRAYAILFDRAFPLFSSAEIYLDGELVQTLKREDRAWGRTIQIDATAKTRVVGIKLTAPKETLTLNGTVALAEEGTAPPPLDLASDWQYQYQANNINPDGSMMLTIGLSGVKKYEGFDLAVNYEIYPGEEPFVAKWFAFTSHRPTRFLIEEATYDQFPTYREQNDSLPNDPIAQRPNSYSFSAFNAVTIETNPTLNQGFLAATLSPLGATERSEDGRTLAAEIRPYFAIKPDVPITFPKSLVGLFQGSVASGIFLHQQYVAAYQTRMTPNSFPIAYNTTYPYGIQISAATCSKIIPLASEIGARLFVVGDGWQINAMPNSGTKGDWITDRAPAKFPSGLMPISLEARMHRMRFGLWSDPVSVDDGSKAQIDHPEWRLKTIEGVNIKQMCFTSGWADLFSSSMQLLCRELTATYLELDRDMLYDGCVDPTHLHPVAHSLPQQLAHREIFHDKMRKVTPEFLVSGTDELRRAYSLPAPTPEQNTPAFWFNLADQSRRRLQSLLLTRPPFTVIGTVPVHLPTEKENLPALEYYYASVAGMTGNLELQGDLEKITAGERDLAKRWTAWTEENREWLAFVQPLALVGMEASVAEGSMHLRNAYKGKHGFLCLYNPSDAPITVEPGFRPADYNLKMNPAALTMSRVRDNATVGFAVRNGIVQVKPLELPPHSWEIIEVRTK